MAHEGYKSLRDILLVEDDELTLNFEKEMFSIIYPDSLIFHASNGLEGIRLFETNYKTIDLVVLDLDLPLKDGFEVYKAIRETCSEIDNDESVLKIVLFTASPDDDERVIKMKQMGLKNIIEKPCYASDLIDRIKEAK